MIVVLPTSFLLCWCVLWRWRQNLGISQLSLRSTFLISFVVVELFIFATSQLLSIHHHLRLHGLEASWGCFIIFLIFALVLGVFRQNVPIPSFESLLKRVRNRFHILGLENSFWLFICVGIVGVLAWISLRTTPDFGDALVYHLARVAHWQQNGSVLPYPTHYLYQIEMSPLSEYNLLQSHLLSGGGRFDPTAQIVALIVSLVGVSEIVRLLKGSMRTQVIAVVLCATIPTGILQATAVENEYVCAAFGVCLIAFLLSLREVQRWLFMATIVGLTCGLGYLTKGTFPILFAPVAVILLTIFMFNDLRFGSPAIVLHRWLGACLTIIVSAVATATAFLLECRYAFGSFIGPGAKGLEVVNPTVASGAANVIRSVASNFNIGDGSRDFPTIVARIVLTPLRVVFGWTGISPLSEKYAMASWGSTVFKISDYRKADLQPAVSASPWHVLLIFSTLVVLIILVGLGRYRFRLPLAIGLGLTFGFISFTALDRWSIFGVRLQLPLMVAWCALIALVLVLLPKVLVRVVLALLVVACLPQVFSNSDAPFFNYAVPVGSTASYFVSGRTQAMALNLGSQYDEVSKMMVQSGCESLGIANWVLFEYPLWVSLEHAGWHGTIQDVNVGNESARLGDPNFIPCALIQDGSRSPTDPTQEPLMAHLQSGQFALALDPLDAALTAIETPGFSSSSAGTRIFPGAGWALQQKSHALMSAGSLLVVNTTGHSTSVDLLVTGATQGIWVVSGHGVIATTLTSGEQLNLTVPVGVYELGISAQGSSIKSPVSTTIHLTSKVPIET